MGAGAPPRRRDRRLGAADARRLPLLGPRGGRLRARARRRPRRRRAPLRRLAARRARRRGDPALRAALAAQPGVPRAPRPARAAPPQHHAARVLRGLGRRARAHLPDRARGAVTLAPHCSLGLADSEFNRLELEALGVARTGVLPICLDFERYREPASPVLRRMLETAPSTCCSSGGSRRTSGREDLIRLASYWRRFLSQDVRAAAGRASRRAAAPTSTRCRRSRTRRASRRPR